MFFRSMVDGVGNGFQKGVSESFTGDTRPRHNVVLDESSDSSDEWSDLLDHLEVVEIVDETPAPKVPLFHRVYDLVNMCVHDCNKFTCAKCVVSESKRCVHGRTVQCQKCGKGYCPHGSKKEKCMTCCPQCLHGRLKKHCQQCQFTACCVQKVPLHTKDVYKCQFCDESFSTRKSLQQHLRLH
jgi:hypothetical protein